MNLNVKTDVIKIIVSAAAAGLLALLGSYFPPILMVLPGVLALFGLLWNYTSFIAAVVAAAAVCTAIPGITLINVIQLIALFLPTAVILYFGFYFRRSYRGVLVLSCVASTLGFYLLLTLPSILAGNAPFDELVSSFEAFSQSFTSALPAFGVTKEMAAEITDQLDTMKLLFPTVLPAFVITSGMCAAFLSFLIAALPAGKRRSDGMRPMAPFHLWKLGWSFTTGMAILFAGGLLISFTKLESAQAIFMAVQMVLMLPLALQGLCCDTFLSRLRNRSAGRRAFFYIMLVLLIPYSVMFLMLYGLFDQLFHIRDRLTPKPPEQQQDM